MYFFVVHGFCFEKKFEAGCYNDSLYSAPFISHAANCKWFQGIKILISPGTIVLRRYQLLNTSHFHS
jgi:hypothetical protein